MQSPQAAKQPEAGSGAKRDLEHHRPGLRSCRDWGFLELRSVPLARSRPRPTACFAVSLPSLRTAPVTLSLPFFRACSDRGLQALDIRLEACRLPGAERHERRRHARPAVVTAAPGFHLFHGRHQRIF